MTRIKKGDIWPLLLSLLVSTILLLPSSSVSIAAKEAGYIRKTFDPDHPVNEIDKSSFDFQTIDLPSVPVKGDANAVIPKSIPVADDHRQLVQSTTKFPNSAVCKLEMVFEEPNGLQTSYCGSGFMISDTCLLTAAHCLTDFEHNGELVRLIVTPGMNGEQAPYGSFDSASGGIESYWYEAAYQTTPGDDAFTYDMGLVFLSEPVGQQTGWLRLSTGGKSAGSVRLLGYPYEYKNQITEYYQYQSSGAVLPRSVISRTLAFAAQGSGGQSGGAVLDANDEAVAVFTYGMEDEYTGIDTGDYGGTLIDSERINWIVQSESSQMPVYRAYNPNTGEHFYTRSFNELKVIERAGWKDEGLAWRTADESGIRVYRLYDENRGDHHYTSDRNEYDYLVSIGWKDEGVSWYAPSENPYGTIYRLYNKNARTGQHHFTTSVKERDYLIGAGWADEGAAFDCL